MGLLNACSGQVKTWRVRYDTMPNAGRRVSIFLGLVWFGLVLGAGNYGWERTWKRGRRAAGV